MGCDIHAYAEKRNSEGKWEYICNLNDNRNYLFFGVIAGVRKEENMIFEPKGFPADASDHVKAIADDWEGDGHSHSYLTLSELNSIDENKMIKISGMMDADQLSRLKKDLDEKNYRTENLYPYCGWTNRENCVNFSVEFPIIALLGSGGQLDLWKNELKSLNASPDDVRAVFFFDN